jgi:hypothetical protein
MPWTRRRGNGESSCFFSLHFFSPPLRSLLIPYVTLSCLALPCLALPCLAWSGLSVSALLLCVNTDLQSVTCDEVHSLYAVEVADIPICTVTATSTTFISITCLSTLLGCLTDHSPLQLLLLLLSLLWQAVSSRPCAAIHAIRQ